MDDERERRFRRRKEDDFDGRKDVMKNGERGMWQILYIFILAVSCTELGCVSRIQPF
jgi:hypothetical protein